jgi:hypothetical protein
MNLSEICGFSGGEYFNFGLMGHDATYKTTHTFVISANLILTEVKYERLPVRYLLGNVDYHHTIAT